MKNNQTNTTSELRASVVSAVLLLLLLLTMPSTIFSTIAAATDGSIGEEDSFADGTSNEVYADVGGPVATTEEGDHEDDLAEISAASGEEQDTVLDTTHDETFDEVQDSVTDVPSDEENVGAANDVGSEDALADETTDEEQSADEVVEIDTASDGEEVGVTSDGEQAADEISDEEQASVSDQTSLTSAASDEEEDPVHIYYPAVGGSRISSPPGPSIYVCVGEPTTITVTVKWEKPQGASWANVLWVNVQMVDEAGYGITFDPSSFTLYNPGDDSEIVSVSIPAFSSPGTYQVQIYANVIDQGPNSTPNVAGTNGYFQMVVEVCAVQADLSIDKSGPDYAYAGDTITYTYTVSNAGPDAACNVNVVDDLVSPVTYVSGDDDGDGCIDPGETWIFTATYTVMVGDPDPLVNTATVSSDAEDPNPENNSDTWSVDLIAKICGYKFYDANANGVWDAGEPTVSGFKIELYEDGNLLATTFTAGDGSYCFDMLNAGTYTVTEVLPSGGWINTTPLSITINLLSGEVSEDNNFGNLCLVQGYGGRTLGFWANAGNGLITDEDIAYLNSLNLFKPNGWIYPPFENKAQIRNYLLSASARNMWWMLSAQLIAAILNVRHGFLDGSTLVCVDPPACSTFMTINDIINGAISALGPDTPRSVQEYWKNLLDMLNNNQLPFVSTEPCPVVYP